MHFTGARHGHAGRAVGRVYAWNTAGTTLGGILPNLILFSLVGTAVTLSSALLLYLVTPFLLAGRSLWSGRRLLPIAESGGGQNL